MPVVTLDITHRSPFMEDRAFGDVGPYQWLEGTVHFGHGIDRLELGKRDDGVHGALHDSCSTTMH